LGRQPAGPTLTGAPTIENAFAPRALDRLIPTGTRYEYRR
jgi:hypothetical protein